MIENVFGFPNPDENNENNIPKNGEARYSKGSSIIVTRGVTPITCRR